MSQKDILTRTALDVRKYGAAHSGSNLMTPRIGGVGANIWTDWVPTFYIGGTALDPSHVTIYKCTYTIWGIMLFWQADFFVNDTESLSGVFKFTKPPNYPTFRGQGSGVLREDGYTKYYSVTAKTDWLTDDIYVSWWDGTIMFGVGADLCYMSLQGIGVAKP